ncbi:MAG: type II toxin-antitoxin system VapC family toxin [Magnetococcales bacterium]|nr:type II toxin-antitoxin system VapC family toxin [Magnetococcales bacterium]
MTALCLIDTNVLIDLLGRHPDPEFNSRVQNALSAGAAISIMTTIELLGWRRHTDQSRRDAANLLARMRELPLGRQEAEAAITLRSRSAIRLGDAIIAATALIHHLPLMTRNVSDFKNINGLTLLNPFEAV